MAMYIGPNLLVDFFVFCIIVMKIFILFLVIPVLAIFIKKIIWNTEKALQSKPYW